MDGFNLKTELDTSPKPKNKPEIDIEPSKTKKNNQTKAELAQERVNALKEQNSKSRDDREMRKLYAEKAYSFASYTISFWAFLFLVYFLSPPDKKPLNDTALAIFTTACTINILAAFISIIKGLFPYKK
ncbi:hypothetical protein SC1083_1328 [Aggregatibacter actinomycetemcomitans serotype e str. SC1083]|uniref:Uncharacterized protein n=1 Tax=Aggregatibacter actinomycetemcomitans serotype e str. SC1083 TaxID=907488 RepID=G4A920_AGGAC|nr:hypothetical protein [Aggregatibacter actinomycetemcomitans]EGY33600.1 hypothetical protein SC1083_1328 [Aggregatibacter actinomycetemcomitans serotype e str. SC1083]